ncbi:MAG TPA: effector-associated domain EAD1-containing protein [Chthonomonadaceae bacterium]|nr:effector-associated domain EAD1-containing protein [Chthonomonadaceae bacterium]
MAIFRFVDQLQKRSFQVDINRDVRVLEVINALLAEPKYALRRVDDQNYPINYMLSYEARYLNSNDTFKDIPEGATIDIVGDDTVLGGGFMGSAVVEQLETDGTIKTLNIKPEFGRHEIEVAFADEYEDNRTGPFHFLREDDAQRFTDAFAACKSRRVGKRNFQRTGENIHFSVRWFGIPTTYAPYYVLSLPEYAIPTSLSIIELNKTTEPWGSDLERGRSFKIGRLKIILISKTNDYECHRTVIRDDLRNRFVIYLPCQTSRSDKTFDFRLSCQFVINAVEFSTSEFDAPSSSKHDLRRRGVTWCGRLPEVEERKVNQFLTGNFHFPSPVSGEQIKKLQRALLSAFPEHASLKQFVRTEFNTHLVHIAGGDNLAEIVFNLITWAEAEGRLDELVEKAYYAKVGNKELRAFVFQVFDCRE